MFIITQDNDIKFDVERNIKHFVIITLLVVFIYAIIHYSLNDLDKYILAYLISALGLILGYFYYQKTKNSKVAFLILFTALAVLTYVVFLHGGIGKAGFIWSLLVIVMSYFFLPIEYANKFVFFYSTLVIATSLLYLKGIIELPYEKSTIISISIAIMITVYVANVVIVETVKNLYNLIRLAQYDDLTLIYNRRKLIQILQNEINKANFKKSPLSVLMVDIDNFKRLNDKYGHLFGDEVLKEFAKLIKNSVRRGDIVGRLGGEEFLVVLPDTDIKGAYKVAEKIRMLIKRHFIENFGINITASIGVFQVDEGTSLDEILQSVDLAMYEAKRTGRDRVVVCETAKEFCRKLKKNKGKEREKSPS